jgi:hypothetical protein
MKAKEHPHSKPQEILKWIAVAAVCYLVPAMILFDFSRAAYAMEEHTSKGKEVAWGPRPREFAVKPNTGLPDIYTGSEWPFLVYRPVCYVWRKLHGFEGPER